MAGTTDEAGQDQKKRGRDEDVDAGCDDHKKAKRGDVQMVEAVTEYPEEAGPADRSCGSK